MSSTRGEREAVLSASGAAIAAREPLPWRGGWLALLSAPSPRPLGWRCWRWCSGANGGPKVSVGEVGKEPEANMAASASAPGWAWEGVGAPSPEREPWGHLPPGVRSGGLRERKGAAAMASRAWGRVRGVDRESEGMRKSSPFFFPSVGILPPS